MYTAIAAERVLYNFNPLPGAGELPTGAYPLGTLLRDSDAPVIEIAFQTGWNSLGTFGRVFRDVTGESPSELRGREQASAHQLDQVPHCFVSAAYRPDLKMAVSEKRRLEADDINGTEETETTEETEVP